jgi:glycosyltransferase involved in cell wall biosynthesis
MKIGLDARMYGKAQSGIGTYIQQLTEYLFQLDKTNDYYLFLLEPIFSQYQCLGPNIHKIKAESSWYSWSEQTKFLKLILKYKLDLMHFPHFNAPILYPKKRITTIHDITPNFFPGHKQKSWWRKKAYQLTLKTSLQKSAKIITDSNYTKNDLLKHFRLNEDKIEVIYLGIERHFKVIDNYAKIKELKAKYGLTKPFIFFVSAWRNHKNFEGLIKAFEILKKDPQIDLQLVLGGQEDSFYPNISQTIVASPVKSDIITPGFIKNEDLPLFYQAATLFVIPSLSEGFGIIGLEAMACGTPVVAAKVTSLPEILGSAALYFNPTNYQEMATTIKRVLTNQNLQNDLRAKGFEQVKKYSWPNCAQKTLLLYQKILNQ